MNRIVLLEPVEGCTCATPSTAVYVGDVLGEPVMEFTHRCIGHALCDDPSCKQRHPTALYERVTERDTNRSPAHGPDWCTGCDRHQDACICAPVVTELRA